MDLFLQIIIAIVPAAIVFMTTALFLKKQEEREVKALRIKLKQERQEFFLPNRMEAYQRVILFLERIHPNSLVMRTHNPGLPARAFQSTLVSTIREEYDHNVAQQLYISPNSWNMVKEAKEETLKIINLAGNQMPETALSTDLAAKIFEIVGEVGKLPTEIVIDAVKVEFQEML
ncbi:MAG: hypothetical protein N4A41_01855 [Crocinitomicaceae bacterium]|jgi:hypothetical protein|nr:hypothetical protein [Crocinitomicaceae bacterium]